MQLKQRNEIIISWILGEPAGTRCEDRLCVPDPAEEVGPV